MRFLLFNGFIELTVAKIPTFARCRERRGIKTRIHVRLLRHHLAPHQRPLHKLKRICFLFCFFNIYTSGRHMFLGWSTYMPICMSMHGHTHINTCANIMCERALSLSLVYESVCLSFSIFSLFWRPLASPLYLG